MDKQLLKILPTLLKNSQISCVGWLFSKRGARATIMFSCATLVMKSAFCRQIMKQKVKNEWIKRKWTNSHPLHTSSFMILTVLLSFRPVINIKHQITNNNSLNFFHICTHCNVESQSIAINKLTQLCLKNFWSFQSDKQLIITAQEPILVQLCKHLIKY